jgi:hypothetical protein
MGRPSTPFLKAAYVEYAMITSDEGTVRLLLLYSRIEHEWDSGFSLGSQAPALTHPAMLRSMTPPPSLLC